MVWVGGGLGAARLEAQFVQEGMKLAGSGFEWVSRSVALSADGGTAIVGGDGDYNNPGSLWVFTRSGVVWTQQAKLFGLGAEGYSMEGYSVALSADGNTAIVGGPGDGDYKCVDCGYDGATWVLTRSGVVWTQQGSKGPVGAGTTIQDSKLVGSGAAGHASQGRSVALSADGNTAILGGSSDSGGAGAAWVFTRSGGVWTQQGAKLVGSGAIDAPSQGLSVALSADGNTALVGGPGDTNFAGATWAYRRSGGVWNQYGSKLVWQHGCCGRTARYFGSAVGRRQHGTLCWTGSRQRSMGVR